MPFPNAHMKTEPIFPAASRRRFLKTGSLAAFAGAVAPSILIAPKVLAQNSETLKIGLIGCGGRGSGAAGQAMKADKNCALTAMGDVFEDRLRSSLATLKKENPERCQVDPEKCFVGLDAYKKVLESGVDVVILTTPPGFRPLHLKAAIDAGKHVFCEKPMATDGPGVRSVMESVAEAKRKKLALVAGFCWRYNYGERAIMSRVHDGQIGDIRAIETVYNTGPIWVHPRVTGQTDMEYQLRNWYYFTWLSGDHIVEQAVHSIDKMAWAMKDVPPVSCIATGGRQVRTEEKYGHIFDHFGVVYDYPDGTKGFHFCRQQANCANENSDYIMGSKGLAKIKAFSQLEISGENKWRFSGERPDMYQVEHNELFASIRKGEPLNDGDRMAKSTLLAIMGRMAAYTGQIIKWDDALKSEEQLNPPNLGDWNGPIPVPPVAMPGVTKFA
jgi:myo-inositol 2-dehydrogenase / D-chiro-inositol 1-dehydrogenase